MSKAVRKNPPAGTDKNVGNVNPTQDQNKPITSTEQGAVLGDVYIRTVDRSPADLRKWMRGIQSFESPYYPIQTTLYDLYTNVLSTDGHLSGIISKRFNMTLNKILHFERKDKEGGYVKADEFDELINSDMFRRHSTEILLTQMWGRSGFEYVIGDKFEWRKIPRKHIKLKTQKIAFEQTDINNGIDYTNLWNVWVIGQSDDMGILSSCVQYALLKRGNQADWANYIEIFGRPAWVFKYDAYDEQTKKALDKAIDNIGSGLTIRVPRQADVAPVDAKTSNGNGELQEKFHKAMNAEMSIRILTVTETSNTSSGSGHAQAQVHQTEQQEIIKSDMAYLSNMLNSEHFLNVLSEYGYNIEGGRFVFAKDYDINALKERIKIDIQLVTVAKLPIGDDYFYETYGIPKPDDYEQLKAEMLEENEDDTGKENETEDEQEPDSLPAKKQGKPKIKQKAAKQTLAARWEELSNKVHDFFAQAPQRGGR